MDSGQDQITYDQRNAVRASFIKNRMPDVDRCIHEGVVGMIVGQHIRSREQLKEKLAYCVKVLKFPISGLSAQTVDAMYDRWVNAAIDEVLANGR